MIFPTIILITYITSKILCNIIYTFFMICQLPHLPATARAGYTYSTIPSNTKFAKVSTSGLLKTTSCPNFKTFLKMEKHFLPFQCKTVVQTFQKQNKIPAESPASRARVSFQSGQKVFNFSQHSISQRWIYRLFKNFYYREVSQSAGGEFRLILSHTTVK